MSLETMSDGCVVLAASEVGMVNTNTANYAHEMIDDNSINILREENCEDSEAMKEWVDFEEYTEYRSYRYVNGGGSCEGRGAKETEDEITPLPQSCDCSEYYEFVPQITDEVMLISEYLGRIESECKDKSCVNTLRNLALSVQESVKAMNESNGDCNCSNGSGSGVNLGSVNKEVNKELCADIDHFYKLCDDSINVRGGKFSVSGDYLLFNFEPVMVRIIRGIFY